jgi:drug/metabolite transporter (DMT)-like permease
VVYHIQMMPLVLALAASAAWGSADFLGGRASRGMGALGVATFSKLAGATGLAVACLVAGDVPSREEAAWALGAGLCGAIGLLELYRALALGPMSLVAPLTACGGAVPVVVALAGGEVPGPVTGAGLAVAFIGAVVVSRPPADARSSDAAPARGEPRIAGIQRIALVHSLVAATAIGLALTLLQQAAQAPGDATLGLSLTAALTTVTVLVAITASGGGTAGLPPPAFLPAVVGCGLLDVTANVLFAQASADGRAAVVAVLGSLYPLATVLLARAWLGERLSPAQGVGVLAAMAGVAAIAAGS